MILKNNKHESFAHLVATGTPARTAYIMQGYSEVGADQSASRLLKKAEVAARVAEIKANLAAKAEEKLGIDKAWVLTELVDNAKQAKEINQLSAANRALELVGKELGMFIDRKEVGKPGDFDNLSEEELEQRIRETEAEIAERDTTGTVVPFARKAKAAG